MNKAEEDRKTLYRDLSGRSGGWRGRGGPEGPAGCPAAGSFPRFGAHGNSLGIFKN